MRARPRPCRLSPPVPPCRAEKYDDVTPFPRAACWSLRGALRRRRRRPGRVAGRAVPRRATGPPLAARVSARWPCSASTRGRALPNGVLVSPGPHGGDGRRRRVHAHDGSLLGAARSSVLLGGVYLSTLGRRRRWGWIPFNAGLIGLRVARRRARLRAAVRASPRPRCRVALLRRRSRSRSSTSSCAWSMLLLSYAIELGRVPREVLARARCRPAPQMLPFVLLGYLPRSPVPLRSARR